MKLLPMIMVLFCTGCALASPPRTKFSINVADSETGRSITNAVAKTVFQHQYDPFNSHRNKIDRQEAMVDKDGYIMFSGENLNGSVGATIYVEGYYQDWAGMERMKLNRMLNRWEPWDPVIEVRMRKIKNPVPMITKRIESLKIPKWDEPLGFDLEKGDWIAPYGKGIRSDFFVNMYRRFEHSGDYDAVATITFPNDGDGIQLYEIPKDFQSSSYKFPYEAPVSHYQAKLVLERHATLSETKVSFDPKNDMYIFRVRTQKGKDGNIISACYGRIDRRIEIGWGEVFDFTYHFNPVPNERSLEWNGINLLQK